MDPIQNASTFLIQTLFDLYLFILLLRLILQYLRVDYYNPVTQFIVKATNPLVVPLRRIIPGYWGIDLATVAAIFGITFIKLILLSYLMLHQFPHLLGLLIWSCGAIITLTIKLYFYAVIMNVILSWVAPLSHTPVTVILYRLTEPLMRPARRVIPSIGGFDISPMAVIIGLELLIILIANPLTNFGIMLAKF